MQNRSLLKSWGVVLASFLLAMLLAGGVRAQESPPTDDEVNAIAKELYCPVCENVPLDVCPTLACEQWRELIREKLAEGWQEDQIKDYFVAQYGDRVLAEPPPRGLNWLVYIIPPVTILIGAFVLYRALQAWRVPAAPGAPDESAPAGASDEFVARLEEELKKRA